MFTEVAALVLLSIPPPSLTITEVCKYYISFTTGLFPIPERYA